MKHTSNFTITKGRGRDQQTKTTGFLMGEVLAGLLLISIFVCISTVWMAKIKETGREVKKRILQLNVIEQTIQDLKNKKILDKKNDFQIQKYTPSFAPLNDFPEIKQPIKGFTLICINYQGKKEQKAENIYLGLLDEKG